MQSRLQINRTKDLFNPTEYVKMLEGEFSPWAYNEERAPLFKGRWREDAYGVTGADKALDLEIGTGNGYYFAHYACNHPDRLFVGIEIKYKPLIQSIRRALRGGAQNARIMRYDASLVDELFVPGEINDVFIHHPDPWEKKRHWKHRLIQDDFLETLFELQRPGSWLEFKTDSEDYYDWSLARFLRSRYKVEFQSRDLHNSERSHLNFVTHFESIFIKNGQPIFSARLYRP